MILGACRAFGANGEKAPQRAQFLPDLHPHSPAMGKKDGEKWAAAALLQPASDKPDRLLETAVGRAQGGCAGAHWQEMRRPLRLARVRQQGFTLVELVMVIVIMGVIGGMVSVFMRSPIEAYFATARRAALSDAADSTLRRMSRDIRTALPNSMVVAPDARCVDFIPTKTGGRYRADNTPAGLDFSAADDAFNMLGDNPVDAGQAIRVDDVVVVSNLGIPGSNAYADNNTALIVGVAAVGINPAETRINIAPTLFPLSSPGNRFQVVPATERVVSYACTPQGMLVRAVNTANFTRNCQAGGVINASATVRVNVLAENVDFNACNFTFNNNSQRDGLLRLRLQITDGGETVSLQHQIHVDNTP